MDPLSSNFNPVATVDSVCEGGEYDGFSCMDNHEICGDSGSCINQVCEYNESFQFPLADEKIYIENNLTNTVPIYLNNYNNTPVYGVEIELSFDNSMIDISPISLLEDSIIEDYSIISYVNQENNIFHFVAYSPYPIFSSGLLFELEVNAIGEAGDITSIFFNKSILNDASIANNSLNLVLSEGLLDLEGEIGYYSNINIPIEFVEFNLIGYSDYNNPYSLSVVDTISTLSSSSGEYVFDSALKGLYIMQASKFEPIGSSEGLSAVDASRIARYLIDLIDFNEDQVLAADVDMNGIVSAVDAAFVARYLIGLVDQLNGYNQHWRFRASDNFDLNVIDSSSFNLNLYSLRPLDVDLDDQDIVGIRIGDVDGSWISDAQSRKAYFENSVDLHVDPDKLLTLPIAISQNQLIEGVELNIKYDYEKFLFDNFKLSDTIIDYNVIVNDVVPGELSLIIYASSFVENIDDIFGEASFVILDDELDDSIISLDKILINGRDIESGFLISDDTSDSHIYSRSLSISTSSHPERFELGSAYPNPFNPTTKIPFSVPVESNVNIMIFDISGRFIDEVISGNISPGNHVAVFNGQNFASGVYIVKMQANPIAGGSSFSQSSKVILLK